MIGFIRKWLNKRKELARINNETCDQFVERFRAICDENEAFFCSIDDFLEPTGGAEWEQRSAVWLDALEAVPIQKLKRADHYQDLLSSRSKLKEKIRSNQERIRRHNERVAEKHLQEAYASVGNVEGRKLDRQQMACIIKNAHSHLVLAGAGTGKTTTVVGKIKYLLKVKKCRLEDILVLSFTNASASEMSQRIRAETGERIEASTFHKLGLNIMKVVEEITPNISKKDLREFVREQLQVNMRSEAYLARLSEYLLFRRVRAKSEFEFKTQKEYDEYLKLNPPTTVNNELVKSYGELDIANFLMQNGVTYIYEHPYEHDTRTSEYGQYHPDFYLPEYKIYIEYFGIDRRGEVPSYFSGRDGKTASQTYQDAIQWKRTLHEQMGTVMIECFAYEKMEGTLLENLSRQLQEKGVMLKPRSPQELWGKVAAEGKTLLAGMEELFATVINLIKSNGYTISFVRALNKNNSNQSTNDLLLSLLEPIYNAYERYLRDNHLIDFNDMINISTQYVIQGKYQNPYKYVIVDEYQDISKSRYNLLKALRESRDYELFCVGDDWQSIYRFAGSDVGFILNFSQYWGASEESKIETTYRFGQSLINISSNFVMMNPAQKVKAIRGVDSDIGFALGEINAYTEKYAVEFMTPKLEDLPVGSTVFFIGRYNFDSKMLKDSGLFDLRYDNQSGLLNVTYRKRPDLKMSYLTAHTSKGLQADYVFILNNKNTRMGFPSKIQDAPILDLLLESSDDYPYAEERRLFYVALTRARKKAFLLTVKDRESAFALELRARYAEELKREQFTCPLCGGRLLRKTGRYGDFLGCSNFKSMGCKYTRNIKWKNPEQ